MDSFIKIILASLPILVTGIIVRYILNKKNSDCGNVTHSENNADNNNKKIRVLKFPSTYIRVPIIVSCTMVVLGIVTIILDVEQWLYVIILGPLVVVPFLLMGIFWSLWKVEIRDEYFVYRNWFGKTRAYRYEDVELRWHPRALKWYFYKGEKKVFCMPYYIENEDSLAKCWEKRHKKNRQ